MGSDAIVILGAPVLDEELGLGDGSEPVLVEAVVAEGSVEAFDEGVLHGLAWLDMVKADMVFHGPEVQGFSGELGAVIHGDGSGQAARAGKLLEDMDDGRPADKGIDMDGQALAGEVVDSVQAAEAAAAGELVVDEVHAPALVGTLSGSQGHSDHGWKLLAALTVQGESFLAVDALGAFVVDDKPLGFEDVMEDRGALPGLKSRAVPQAMSQGDIAGRKGVDTGGWNGSNPSSNRSCAGRAQSEWRLL